MAVIESIKNAYRFAACTYRDTSSTHPFIAAVLSGFAMLSASFYVARSQSRAMQGLRQLASGAASQITSLFRRVHPPKLTVSRETAEQFQDMIDHRDYVKLPQVRIISKASASFHNAEDLVRLYQAAETARMGIGFAVDANTLNAIFAKARANPRASCAIAAQQIKNIYAAGAGKDLLKFERLLSVERGKSVPHIEYSFMHDGHQVHEHIENISLDLGRQYLEGRPIQRFKYINGFDALFRPSRQKKKKKAQGMTINARVHTVETQGKKYQEFRSGAFAVHRKNMDKDLQLQLGVAQALPKIGAALESMMHSPEDIAILQERGFLYVEQSLLSDLYGPERRMLEQMDEVFKYLRERENFSIEVRPGAGTTCFEGDTLVVYSEHVEEAFKPDIHLGLCSMGVNEMQSFGMLFAGKKETLQDRLNRETLDMLHGLDPDQEHGTARLPRRINKSQYKDLELTYSIRDATMALGGRHGVNCKSGKDRTSCWATESAQRVLKVEGLKEELISGSSYVLTSQNTGKPSAFAFVAFQRGALPSGFAPPSHLCGLVQS